MHEDKQIASTGSASKNREGNSKIYPILKLELAPCYGSTMLVYA
jgi:hypothetical protein